MSRQWTDSARAKIERFLQQQRQRLAASGADADEVIDDLRRHVEQEVVERNLVVVTEQDVGSILDRLDMPEAAAGADASTPVAAPAASESRTETGTARKPPGWGWLILGVLLPLGTIVFEFITGACAGILFDPLPTLGHAAVVSLVPLANLGLWLALRRGDSRWVRPLDWLSGCALAVASVYTLLFLPVTPFAAIGTLFYGIGFLPLAPLCSLIVAAVLRGGFRRMAGPGTKLTGVWWGAALGLAAILVCSLPMILTNLGLQMVMSDSPDESTRGVRLLRSWGDRGELLRACYGRAGRGEKLYSWGKSTPSETARVIYYRVYGQPFNVVPPPSLYAGRTKWNLAEEEFTWDNDQGGDVVGGRVRGLTLIASRQDAMADPDAALAYLEWTLEFKNDSALQREARAQLALPPGGVVSRLTLWIDGEEREAAFGGRSQVKTAYKAVVQRRRDPVLVTTCGPDHVLVQCFPVPPGGGTMKVRLGVTAPLALPAADTGCLRWPYFVERNFTLRDEFRHSLWAESTQPLETVGGQLKTDVGKSRLQVLRGQLRDKDLTAPVHALRARRADVREVWTQQHREDPGTTIHQTIVQPPITRPDRVILVVDGTVGMGPYIREIGAALNRLPPGIDLAVLVARDGCEDWIPLQKGTADLYQRIAWRKLRSLGGHDNVPALVRAWELAAEGTNSAIVWVHGPQPMLLDSIEELRQRFERSSKPPQLLELQTHPGPNCVLERLDGLTAVRSVMRLGTPGDDLGRLFSSWSGQGGQWVALRERVALALPDPAQAGKQTSMHLARLWAAEEVGRLSAARRTDDASRLAARYQLVTPVSGAVVLETKTQYQQAGLEPVPAATVPTVPEPSTAMLWLLGLALGWACLGRRRRSHPSAID